MEKRGFFSKEGSSVTNARCLWRQGERITQGISCADVADVCLKALHDPVARNKTFEARPLACVRVTLQLSVCIWPVVAK